MHRLILVHVTTAERGTDRPAPPCCDSGSQLSPDMPALRSDALTNLLKPPHAKSVEFDTATQRHANALRDIRIAEDCNDLRVGEADIGCAADHEHPRPCWR